MAWFAAVAIRHVPHALRHYRKETLRLIAQIGMGTGAMAVIGGTVAIIGFVTLSGSSLVAIQGFASLGNIGVEAFTGFFAALINVRIAAPVVAGIAMAATGGPPTAIYSPQSGELVGPDGVKYSVENSTKTGDDGWKDMLAPAG